MPAERPRWAVPGGTGGGWSRRGRLPRRGQDDRAEALGHYTIPLKRDMKPTGVGRTLQICGDPGLCSRAVNMIYSKPFPDGTIKTRGSGFGSVSRSCWGAGRERGRQRGPGTWQGPHVPWGCPTGDSQILSPAGEPGPSRAPARPGGAEVPCVPRGCSASLLPQSREARDVFGAE